MLKTIAIALLTLSLTALTACKDDTAEEYGKAVVGTVDRAERAADSANLAALRTSIQTYRATNGKYPESLKELAMGMDLSRFNYDPKTGAVTLKK